MKHFTFFLLCVIALVSTKASAVTVTWDQLHYEVPSNVNLNVTVQVTGTVVNDRNQQIQIFQAMGSHKDDWYSNSPEVTRTKIAANSTYTGVIASIEFNDGAGGSVNYLNWTWDSPSIRSNTLSFLEAGNFTNGPLTFHREGPNGPPVVPEPLSMLALLPALLVCRRRKR